MGREKDEPWTVRPLPVRLPDPALDSLVAEAERLAREVVLMARSLRLENDYMRALLEKAEVHHRIAHRPEPCPGCVWVKERDSWLASGPRA